MESSCVVVCCVGVCCVHPIHRHMLRVLVCLIWSFQRNAWERKRERERVCVFLDSMDLNVELGSSGATRIWPRKWMHKRQTEHTTDIYIGVVKVFLARPLRRLIHGTFSFNTSCVWRYQSMLCKPSFSACGEGRSLPHSNTYIYIYIYIYYTYIYRERERKRADCKKAVEMSHCPIASPFWRGFINSARIAVIPTTSDE